MNICLMDFNEDNLIKLKYKLFNFIFKLKSLISHLYFQYYNFIYKVYRFIIIKKNIKKLLIFKIKI